MTQLSQPMADIAQVRQQVADLLLAEAQEITARDAMRKADLPKAEVQIRIDELVSYVAGTVERAWFRRLLKPGQVDIREVAKGLPPGATLLALVAPKMLSEALLDMVEDQRQHPPGLPAAEREERVRAKQERIDALARQRQAIAAEAERLSDMLTPLTEARIIGALGTSHRPLDGELARELSRELRPAPATD